MFNTSRFLLSGLSTPSAGLKPFNQFRCHSSKQMLMEPGIGSCCAGIKRNNGCAAPKPPKQKGPSKKLYIDCVENPNPPKTYDEQFKHLLKHKKRTVFQKTWKECVPLRLMQKVCVDLKPEPPSSEVDKPKSQISDLGYFDTNIKCPKIRMPGCKPAEYTKLCRHLPHPIECEKVKCPYPSFSECERAKPKRGRKTECLSFPTCASEILHCLKSKKRLKEP